MRSTFQLSSSQSRYAETTRLGEIVPFVRLPDNAVADRAKEARWSINTGSHRQIPAAPRYVV